MLISILETLPIFRVVVWGCHFLHVGSLWVLSLVRFIGKSKLPLGVSAYGCLSLSVLAQRQTVQGVP